MLLSSLIDNKIGDSFALDIVQGVLKCLVTFWWQSSASGPLYSKDNDFTPQLSQMEHI